MLNNIFILGFIYLYINIETLTRTNVSKISIFTFHRSWKSNDKLHFASLFSKMHKNVVIKLWSGLKSRRPTQHLRQSLIQNFDPVCVSKTHTIFKLLHLSLFFLQLYICVRKKIIYIGYECYLLVYRFSNILFKKIPAIISL